MGNPKYFRQSLGAERIVVQPLSAEQMHSSSYEAPRIIAPNPKYRGVIEFSAPCNTNISFERTDGSGGKKIAITVGISTYLRFQNCWSQDGNSLYIACLSQGVLFRVDPQSGQVDKLKLNSVKNPTIDEDEYQLCGMDNHGKFLISTKRYVLSNSESDPSKKPNKAFHFLAVGFGKEANYSRKFVVAIPFYESLTHQDLTAGALALPSNHGDKVLIAGAFLQEIPIFKWLHAKIPSFPDGKRFVEEAWLGNIDGTDMRLVGYLPVEAHKKVEPFALEPRWSPDDSQVSFMYNDGIYSVPAK